MPTLIRQPYRVQFLDRSSEDGESSPDRWPVETLATANAISSHVVGNEDLHLPVLDIDYEAALVPSSTPGHYHLFLDKPVAWDDYVDLLNALAACDIIEPGYASAAIARGATYVRKPGVRKHEHEADREVAF